MKRLLITSLVAVALISNSAFAQEHQHADGKHQHQDQQKKSLLSETDHLQIAVQQICPVMGAELGSMGEPIKVKMGEQNAYLCCKSCMGKQVDAKHWTTIQTNIAAAQGTCPIMGKAVSASMKSTVVNGQQVFVCCPPCIEKIQADPTTALTKVNASYVTFAKAAAQVKSDNTHIAAQGICPVSGQKLGAMGAPIKVKVGEENAFLCCTGCQGKELNAGHWKTVQTNLAKAQGVCPVMGEAIDASMKSAVVNGRKIFVCCPPCIAKVKAAPATYVTMLNTQIANGGKAVAAHSHDHEGHDHEGHDHKDHDHKDHKHDK